jgi:flagellin
MRELAVQSASDGVNGDDRASIDLEFQQLKAEITRIGDGTEYNDMKLINGNRAKGLTLDANGDVDTGTHNTAIQDHGLAADSVKVSSSTANGEYKFVADSDDTIKLTDADNNELDSVTKADGFGNNDYVHFDKVGIVVQLDDTYQKATLHDTNLTVADGVFTTVQVGSNNDTNVDHDSAAVTENRITFNMADTTSEGLGISAVDLTDLGNAQQAINELDSAIAKVNDERSNIGSLQNRFEFTSSNLMNSIQNNSASMSTIRDADFAVEAADLARNQILTQSGTAMLAQANSLSQNVLRLIR